MPQPDVQIPPLTLAASDRSVVIGGDNHGTINTGVIVNIQGDDVERNIAIGRAVLAAALLAAPLEPVRKHAVENYLEAVAQTLNHAAAELRQGIVPHGTCGAMHGYAEHLASVLGDVIGQAQATALGDKLRESYEVEKLAAQFMQLPADERDAKFAGLDEAAGYLRAAAKSLLLRR